MDSTQDYWSAHAALTWQLELGADEAICDAPVDRYALEAVRKPAPSAAEGRATLPVVPKLDPVEEARAAARSAADLSALAQAMEAFEHCELKRGARRFVFCDGNPASDLMIVGEAPGRDEDREGKPFVGRAGQLLDRMLGAIGHSRSSPDPAGSAYITNVLPWRPPENRKPQSHEMAMFLPFLEAHIALAQPKVLILMGNTPCEALLGRSGITRLRGSWQEVLGIRAMPMFHPAYLLRQPQAKREAWADLLSIEARLMEST